MDFINDIKEKTIIICNDYVKELIISSNKLLPIKVMSLVEFITKYCYSYDEEAILFVMDEYRCKYEIAKEYIDNTYYVNDISYGNSKLDLLVDIKEKLTRNNLLITNDKFREYAKRVKIIIYDIDLDNYTMNIFSGLDVKIIERTYRDFNHLVYHFDTLLDEVSYVANKIAELVANGTDINKIILTNIDKNYFHAITRIFSIFNLKVNIPRKRLLCSYPLVKDFIMHYRDSNDINEALNLIDKNNPIYNELIKVINQYLKYENKELLIYKIEHSYISDIKYDKMIRIANYLEYIPVDDEYVFMLNFNEGSIPKYLMDTDYLSDNIRPTLGLKTTVDYNRDLKEKTIKIIKDIKNLTITLKDSDNTRRYYESSLCNLFPTGEVSYDNTVSYSTLFDKIRLVNCYDNYFKFGEYDKDFDLLNNNYNVDYNSYKHEFTGINNKMDKLYLSYSKMNTYNKCSFRYYLDNILKLDIYEENFSAFIGSVIHYVMEKCLSNNDTDIHKYVKEYVGDKELSKKEQFFLDKYTEGIKGLLDQVLLEKEYSSFTDSKYETKIDIDCGGNTYFVGIIDKILYLVKDGKTYLSLVDYKTGDDDISLVYLDEGINIQLPIYLYLTTHLGFKDVVYTGFYLQKFKLTSDDYRLEGYSNSDPDVISIADKNYMDSKIIKGLKINKDGSFARYSKVLSNDEIDLIIKKTKDIIDKTIKNIRNNEFKINPKATGEVNIGCLYCKYKDICFMTKDDEVIIHETDWGGE